MLTADDRNMFPYQRLVQQSWFQWAPQIPSQGWWIAWSHFDNDWEHSGQHSRSRKLGERQCPGAPRWTPSRSSTETLSCEASSVRKQSEFFFFRINQPVRINWRLCSCPLSSDLNVKKKERYGPYLSFYLTPAPRYDDMIIDSFYILLRASLECVDVNTIWLLLLRYWVLSCHISAVHK